MKVFISWSGDRSKAVALLLRDWISCTLQASRPWISTRDLDRGSLWFNEISDQLKDTSVGIVCLTQENKDRPWILFEAGALMKGLSASRVCTLLIDLQPKDIEDPLAQFNHTFPTRESFLSLIETLNNHLGDGALDHRVLGTVFDTYWPQFETKFKHIIETVKPAKPSTPRPADDILAEILGNTRQLSSRVTRLEDIALTTFDVAGPPLRRGPPIEFENPASSRRIQFEAEFVSRMRDATNQLGMVPVSALKDMAENDLARCSEIEEMARQAQMTVPRYKGHLITKAVHSIHPPNRPRR